MRADQLQVGGTVKHFHHVDRCVVTKVLGPHHPHLSGPKKDRVCVRVQFDNLSWVLFDLDHELEEA